MAGNTEYGRKHNFLMTFIRVKILDCKHDSISGALIFHNEFVAKNCRKMDSDF